jgi:ATP/maltotriose-dependent transcriptional regulator MalT
VWYEQSGSIYAIHHRWLLTERSGLIEQNYVELLNRGEMSALRFWTGKLSKELVYSRPRLCLYEAQSHSWFGELDEADVLLEAAEKRIRSEISAPDADSMLGQLAYVKSRVTAMRGDLPRAIEFNLAAREYLLSATWPTIDLGITLGYLCF